MQKVVRVLICGGFGLGVCALVSCLLFFSIAVFGGTGAGEAFAFSLLVALVGAGAGAVVGLAVAFFGVDALGGFAIGAAVSFAIAGIYVLAVGDPSNYGYFVSESRLIFVVMWLPVCTAGITTSLFSGFLASR